MTRHSITKHAAPFQGYSSIPWNRTALRACMIRFASTASRFRRNDIWIPQVRLKQQDDNFDATEQLIQAGYLRKAYSGIYHMLPLGLRVQNKLENLIDKHMQSIRASKVSLSSISSRDLWRASGRLSTGSEFFKFLDRKNAQWLLAPTHEEEITHLLRHYSNSPGDYPIRLYQVSRKYRDEKRPRGGLLRGREFIMKDLYTFDISQEEAHNTYGEVRQAYRNFLSELKIDYVEARADSGNMGGNLSHEYHFPSVDGEDDIIHCSSCDYARNEEWVPECAHQAEPVSDQESNITGTFPQLSLRTFIDTSGTKLIKAYAPTQVSDGAVVGLNTHAVKAAVKQVVDLDTGVEQAEEVFSEALRKRSAKQGSVYYVFDSSIDSQQVNAAIQQDQSWRVEMGLSAFRMATSAKNATPNDGAIIDYPLLKQVSGNVCPQCKTGVLQVDKAIEIGHTFHLGTRYSSKLRLIVRSGTNPPGRTPVEMGCHGIGISRLIAAVAGSLADSKGLNWPSAIAPFHVVIIADGKHDRHLQVAEKVYDAISEGGKGDIDILLDDRTTVSNVYKMKDADLIGYPVIIVIGRAWQESKMVELQCRRLSIKKDLEIGEVKGFVKGILNEL